MADLKTFEVPEGYALVSIEALKAWGKYDEVSTACQYPVQQEEPPREYLLQKLQMVMPLFQEARDALPALSILQVQMRGIKLDLADRMDEVGTYNVDKWRKENQK